MEKEKQSDITENRNGATQSPEERVTLIEDFFGFYFDDEGYPNAVKRFTWRNTNKIEIQVITYGARIVSMKFPDRNGVIDDIVLGFDDLEGYIFYKKYYFGATIGRMTNMVKDSTVLIGRKRYQVKPNTSEYHQKNGGQVGFDQKLWDAHIEGKKVIMSYVSPDGEEDYPGSLMTRVTFELSERNEFKINMEAFTTLPTVVNLSNLLFFNLAGHYAGPESIYKHVLTLNCNCFTKQDNNGFSTGEIQNVVHTINDFQIPKTLGKVMGIVAKDGFYQNFCINRGVNQDECFVARVLHPPTGRLLELYSNQYGVQFDTANCFGYGIIQSIEEILSKSSYKSSKSGKSTRSNKIVDDNDDNFDSALQLIDDIHVKMMNRLKREQSVIYTELRGVIEMLRKSKNKVDVGSYESLLDFICDDTDALNRFCSSPKQVDFLKLVKESIMEVYEETEHNWLTDVLDKIIHHADTLQAREQFGSVRAMATTEELPDAPTPPPSLNGDLKTTKAKKPKINKIPKYFDNSDRIIGKGRRLYGMHGGIALQTQNYPNCANIDYFPNCVLKPGEKYSHTITYKFWIRSGNPSRWIKRNLHEMTQMKKNVT